MVELSKGEKSTARTGIMLENLDHIVNGVRIVHKFHPFPPKQYSWEHGYHRPRGPVLSTSDIAYLQQGGGS